MSNSHFIEIWWKSFIPSLESNICVGHSTRLLLTSLFPLCACCCSGCRSLGLFCRPKVTFVIIKPDSARHFGKGQKVGRGRAKSRRHCHHHANDGRGGKNGPGIERDGSPPDPGAPVICHDSVPSSSRIKTAPSRLQKQLTTIITLRHFHCRCPSSSFSFLSRQEFHSSLLGVGPTLFKFPSSLGSFSSENETIRPEQLSLQPSGSFAPCPFPSASRKPREIAQ